MDTNAIATLTNRQASEIATVETWAKVFFVKFVSGSPRFVSIAKVAELMAAQSAPVFEFTLDAGRRRSKPWVRKITGLSGDQYKVEGDWVQPTSIEWDRKGCVSADYSLSADGYYQDSCDGYYQIKTIDGEMVAKIVTLGEIIYKLEKAAA